MRRPIPQSRAERLIAACRFALAAGSLGSVYFDHTSQLPASAFAMLIAYAVYALIVAIWTEASRTTSRRWILANHILDMTFFGWVNYVGPSSPFFSYFVFGIICATLRFGRRGTMLTTLAATSVFIASSAASVPAATFELNRFIIRAAYLLVLASMLIFLADYHERIQRDLARIARWPRSPRRGHDELLESLLREATSIFSARRAVLAYEHLSERFAFQGEWDGGAFKMSEIYEPNTAEAVVSTKFQGEFVRGQLFLFEGTPPLLEEMNLAEIAGTVIAARLDHFHAALQLQRGAVAEERVRVARDLHDFVLQSLTGVALQLRTLPRRISENPEEALTRLVEIEQVIAAGQKELRRFIDDLRLEPDDFDQLERRFREQWAIDVDSEVSPVVHLLPLGTRYEIHAIVNEAVANAAKHAQAKRIALCILVEDGHVLVDVADDGRGFPFHGRYDLQSLIATNRGPVTLKERVSALGGSMVLDSSVTGAHLEIRVPLSQ
jgi:signal transduction histidine kinase